MSKGLIWLRHTDRLAGRKQVDIEFPVRIRIVSRTPKAVLAEPLRTRRHGCYVPRIWIPRSLIPEPVHDDQDVIRMDMPLWLWEKNSRPEPEK